MLTLYLPPEIESRLEALATATGNTKDFHASEAIREYLEDLEDLHLAEQRLADFRAGRSKMIPLEVVMKKYGLAD